MKLSLAVIMVMSLFTALAQQPLGEVTYFFELPTSQNQSAEEPHDVPSYAEAVADTSPSEEEQQRYVFLVRDGQTLDYKLARWTDPFTTPQIRTVCLRWDKVAIPNSGTAVPAAKVCIDHDYQFKTMEVELILHMTVAGQGDPQEIRMGLDEIFKQHYPALAAVTFIDCYITDCGSAVSTAKFAFFSAIEGHGTRMGVLPSEFGLEVDTTSAWSDWK